MHNSSHAVPRHADSADLDTEELDLRIESGSPPSDQQDPQVSLSSDPEQLQPLSVELASPAKASNSILARFWQCTQAFIRLIWSSGVTCGCLSSGIMATNALLVKLVSDEVPVFQIVAARSVLTCSITFVTARVAGISPLYGQRQHYAWLMARGLCGTTAMTIYYGALHLLPLADAITLSKVAPVLTALLAAVVVGEALSPAGFLCSCAGLVGVAFTAHPPFLFGGGVEWSQQRLLGICLDLASALASAGAYICIRHIQTSEPALTVALWFHTSSLLVSIVPLAVGIPAFPVLPRPLSCLILLAVGITSFIGQLFLGRSYQLGSAGRISAIDYTQVVYGHVAGVTLLHEKETWYGLTGTALIACGAVGANLFKPRPKPLSSGLGSAQLPSKEGPGDEGESAQLLNGARSDEADRNVGRSMDLEAPDTPVAGDSPHFLPSSSPEAQSSTLETPTASSSSSFLR
ncbi:hypothetical protein WJX74_005509 [Apatococcus lobatus]|uniref:EamA domain-containing protein n=1 Tax=Apatococcus lobatus TaxID=904363 RepID=A0AAW1QIW4_9CHLO